MSNSSFSSQYCCLYDQDAEVKQVSYLSLKRSVSEYLHIITAVTPKHLYLFLYTHKPTMYVKVYIKLNWVNIPSRGQYHSEGSFLQIKESGTENGKVIATLFTVLYPVHCALCTVYCTLCTVNCTLRIVNCTLYTVNITPNKIHCALHAVHQATYSVNCTLCTVKCMF